MPLSELKRRLWNHKPQGRLSRWEISLKNISNARDATNTLARSIKNIRIRLEKEYSQISITKLRDRKQVVSQPIHKSNIIQSEAVIYLNNAGTEHHTLLVTPKSHILLVWQGSEAGEPFLIFGHVSWATRIHEPRILQASIHHLHRTRKGRWLSAGVSEINLRNLAHNHATRRSLHSPLHLTTWPSGTWTTTGKTWTIQLSRLKVGVGPSSWKIRPTRETITTLRTWAVTKASRLMVVLSWTKTIWVMVRSIRELRKSTWRSARWSTRVKARQNMRIRMRWEINKLITVWVSCVLNMSPLNSLTPEGKLIQVTSTATKYANKSFLSWLWGFFPYFSLWVEGWLWVGWVVSFSEFDCCFLFVVGGDENELGSTLLILILTPLKTNTQSVCGFGCTLLNPAQILLNHFLAQNGFLKTHSQISDLLLKLGVLLGIMKKLTLEGDTCFTWRG
jgi:hypothetical protein